MSLEGVCISVVFSSTKIMFLNEQTKRTMRHIKWGKNIMHLEETCVYWSAILQYTLFLSLHLIRTGKVLLDLNVLFGI